MTVYLLYSGEYEDRDVAGVYVDREMAVAAAMPAAEAWVAWLTKHHGGKPPATSVRAYAEMDVKEFVVIPAGALVPA